MGEDNVVDDLELIQPILDALPDYVSEQERECIKQLLLKYIDAFAKHDYDIGRAKTKLQRLELIDDKVKPIREPLRAHPYAYLQMIMSKNYSSMTPSLQHPRALGQPMS